MVNPRSLRFSAAMVRLVREMDPRPVAGDEVEFIIGPSGLPETARIVREDDR